VFKDRNNLSTGPTRNRNCYRKIRIQIKYIKCNVNDGREWKVITKNPWVKKT